MTDKVQETRVLPQAAQETPTTRIVAELVDYELRISVGLGADEHARAIVLAPGLMLRADGRSKAAMKGLDGTTEEMRREALEAAADALWADVAGEIEKLEPVAHLLRAAPKMRLRKLQALRELLKRLVDG